SNGPILKIAEKRTRDYLVNINFDECTYKHTFHVEYVPDVSLGADTTLCTGETLLLEASHPVKDYHWSDGSCDSIKLVNGPGNYAVMIPHTSCVVQDSIEVSFVDCPGFAPNIITSNEDNYNDYFVFENIESRIWSLEVFNRWGEMVYYSQHYE